MYLGKAEDKKRQEEKQRKIKQLKEENQKNTDRAKEVYASFQLSMNQFAKSNKDRINSDSKFRQHFSQMCQEFDINPMLAEKNIWTDLGFGDFYHHLSTRILDICARQRHKNGGIMKIDAIVDFYNLKEKQKISKDDVVRAMGKLHVLGNASIIDKQYVCTVPIQLNANLPELLKVAEKYGFLSGKLLKLEKGWGEQEFSHRVMDLRKKGIVWSDNKIQGGPHFYFLSHLGTDFSIFRDFMAKY